MGVIFGIVGIILRTSIREEDSIDEELVHAANNTEVKENPIKLVFRDAHYELIFVLSVAAFWGCSYYTSFIWM